jgi:hypothetical protein
LIYIFYSESEAPDVPIKDVPPPVKREEKKSKKHHINPGDLWELKRGPQVVVIRRMESSDTRWLVWNRKSEQLNTPEARMFEKVLKSDQQIEPSWIEAANAYEKGKAQNSEPQER